MKVKMLRNEFYVLVLGACPRYYYDLNFFAVKGRNNRVGQKPGPLGFMVYNFRNTE